jgi:uncharacterized membrane protein YkvI
VKIAALAIAVLAILIGVVPMFSDCESQGRSLTLANGREIPMKCHWTGLAELAMAAPLLVVGSLMATSKRRESLRNAGLIAAALGVFVILLPATLIGVCGNPDMSCNSVMKPALILMGSLVLVGGLAVAFQSLRQKEETA